MKGSRELFLEIGKEGSGRRRKNCGVNKSIGPELSFVFFGRFLSHHFFMRDEGDAVDCTEK